MYTVLLYVLRYIAGQPGEERAQHLFETWVDWLREAERGKRRRLLERMRLSLEATEPGSLEHRYLVDSIGDVEEGLREIESADHDEVVAFWWLRRIGAKTPDRCSNSIREMMFDGDIGLIFEVAQFCTQELGRFDYRDLPSLSREAVMARAKRLVNCLEEGDLDRANQLLRGHEPSWTACSEVAIRFNQPPGLWSHSGYSGQTALVTA